MGPLLATAFPAPPNAPHQARRAPARRLSLSPMATAHAVACMRLLGGTLSVHERLLWHSQGVSVSQRPHETLQPTRRVRESQT